MTMPLALNRTGVIFKKCDMAAHRPDSNKACGAGTCQHTCQHTCKDIERCPHAWTLRYWADGKQRKRSFKDEIRHGRTVYGSGRKLAQDAQLKLTMDKRAGDKTFADYVKAGKANFGEAAEAFIARLQVNNRSRELIVRPDRLTRRASPPCRARQAHPHAPTGPKSGSRA
jgi:hypothetical protein